MKRFDASDMLVLLSPAPFHQVCDKLQCTDRSVTLRVWRFRRWENHLFLHRVANLQGTVTTDRCALTADDPPRRIQITHLSHNKILTTTLTPGRAHTSIVDTRVPVPAPPMAAILPTFLVDQHDFFFFEVRAPRGHLFQTPSQEFVTHFSWAPTLLR